MLHPVIASREVTRYILQAFHLKAKKKFGQNFLINEQVVLRKNLKLVREI